MPPKLSSSSNSFLVYVKTYEERRKKEPGLAAMELYGDFACLWMQFCKEIHTAQYRRGSEQSVFDRITLFLHKTLYALGLLVEQYIENANTDEQYCIISIIRLVMMGCYTDVSKILGPIIRNFIKSPSSYKDIPLESITLYQSLIKYSLTLYNLLLDRYLFVKTKIGVLTQAFEKAELQNNEVVLAIADSIQAEVLLRDEILTTACFCHAFKLRAKWKDWIRCTPFQPTNPGNDYGFFIAQHLELLLSLNTDHDEFYERLKSMTAFKVNIEGQGTKLIVHRDREIWLRAGEQPFEPSGLFDFILPSLLDGLKEYFIDYPQRVEVLLEKLNSLSSFFSKEHIHALTDIFQQLEASQEQKLLQFTAELALEETTRSKQHEQKRLAVQEKKRCADEIKAKKAEIKCRLLEAESLKREQLEQKERLFRHKRLLAQADGIIPIPEKKDRFLHPSLAELPSDAVTIASSNKRETKITILLPDISRHILFALNQCRDVEGCHKLEAFVCGGLVRDMVLGKVSEDPDMDFVVNGIPDFKEKIAFQERFKEKLAEQFSCQKSDIKLRITGDVACYCDLIIQGKKYDLYFSSAENPELGDRLRDAKCNCLRAGLPPDGELESIVIEGIEGAIADAQAMIYSPVDMEFFFKDPIRILRALYFKTRGYSLEPAEFCDQLKLIMDTHFNTTENLTKYLGKDLAHFKAYLTNKLSTIKDSQSQQKMSETIGSVIFGLVADENPQYAVYFGRVGRSYQELVSSGDLALAKPGPGILACSIGKKLTFLRHCAGEKELKSDCFLKGVKNYR